jgi:predicted SAM-dependent methyltransferase
MGVGLRTALVRARWRAGRRAREAVLRRADGRTIRADIAARYLRGDGIEIGGLDIPLHLPSAARVRYVDRKDLAGLRADFPNLAHRAFVNVDVVDDGEVLSTFGSDELDFVVANHMIEHTQDPIGTLEAHVRVLRPGGMLYLAVPDRRYTFDAVRDRTPLEHHLRDHEEGPQWSRREHYIDWVRHIEKFDDADVEARARQLEAEKASIHFHVWELEDFVALAGACRAAFGLQARILHVQANHGEFVVVLRKDGPHDSAPLRGSDARLTGAAPSRAAVRLAVRSRPRRAPRALRP